MASKAENRFRRLVDRFVSDLQSVVESTTRAKFQKKVEQFAEGLGAQPMDVRPREPKVVPCPIEGCVGHAAPRYGMVCKDHKDLPHDEKVLARDRAKRPGGVWFKAKEQRVAS